MEQNNLRNIFDAIVGYDGAASVDGWRHMTHDDLVEQAQAQAETHYSDICASEADAIAATVIRYREADNSTDAFHVRDGLSA